MHLSSILTLAAACPISAVNDLLRAIGIAAIGYLLFRGYQALTAKSPVTAPAGPQPATAVRPAPAPAAAPAAEESIPAEIVAVIAAAVATVTGSSRRIVAIKTQASLWEKAGRQSVLTSHRIR